MTRITAGLGVAFYTTIVALIESAILVFVQNVVQRQEELVLNSAADHCLDQSREPHPSRCLMGFHRPARQIEVFDISLMAVVTKAMGAFLVIMILLMPYYVSDPDVSATSSRARDELKEARKEMEAMARAMADSPSTPEAMRKALQEMEHSLEEADRNEDQLAKEAQALSSQLHRARKETDAAKAAAERAEAAAARAEKAEAATEQTANAEERAKRLVEAAEGDMEALAEYPTPGKTVR